MWQTDGQMKLPWHMRMRTIAYMLSRININFQSSHENNVKMTSIILLHPHWNFKFHLRLASHYCVFWCRTLSVNVSHDNGIIWSMVCCRNGHFVYDKCYIFVHFSPTHTLTLNVTKSSESQWNIHSNDILSTLKYCQLFTHKSNIFLGKQYVIPPIETNGGANAEKWQKPCQKQPLLFEAHGPNLVHQHPLHSPSQMTARSLYALLHNYATKSPLVTNTMGHPNSPPKLSLPLQHHQQNLIHPFLNLPLSPPQTASGSNLPFCHNALCGQTDGPGKCSVTWALSLTMLIESDMLKIHHRWQMNMSHLHICPVTLCN